MVDLLSEGKHVARATGVYEWGQKANGNEFVFVDFEITRGAEQGRRIGHYFYFTEKTADRSVEALRNCGCTFPDNDPSNLDGLTKNEVELVVEHDEYDGKVNAKIKWVNNLIRGVKEEEKMTTTAKASFRERMKGVLVAAKQSEKRVEKSGANLANDSDVPF